MEWDDRPILVTGAARSGTSLIAGIISLCGAWMGKCTGPTHWNRKGQFENEMIRDALVKPLLKKSGFDPMGQNPLPPRTTPVLDPSWREMVLGAIRTQGYDGRAPWMYKGAKMCLVWRTWDAAFPEARWIVVRRDQNEIVNSCLKTSFMRKCKGREGWMEWVLAHEEYFIDMELGVKSLFSIWPEQLIEGDEREIRTILEIIGLEYNEKAVREFVDRKLWTTGG